MHAMIKTEVLTEAVVPTVEGMDDHGWSNSPHAKDAPDDVHPEVAELEPQEPGFSNAKAVTADDDQAADSDETPKKPAAKRTRAKG